MLIAKRSLVLLIALTLCVACSPLTTKKTSTWMNSMYSAQYNEYLTWFEENTEGKLQTRATVTEEQKEILRVKKRIFVELHPLLDAYAIYASTSESPAGFDMSIVEDRIIELINRLMYLTMAEENDDARPNPSINDPGRHS